MVDRPRERGLLTIQEVAQPCGVSTKTISERRQKGLLRGHA
ncbi:MAG: type IV toxin-antitoxin system AbiEi family antitoxin domain-containing protein [Acidobacteriaceae bacterium]|nr:type IV toxin-antitoxin system AbiEi family antitoxin domain-containing protein [Acidobacteriaceae bacterium]